MSCPRHKDAVFVLVESVKLCPECLEDAISKVDLGRYIKSRDIRDRAREFMLLAKRARIQYYRKEDDGVFSTKSRKSV